MTEHTDGSTIVSPSLKLPPRKERIRFVQSLDSLKLDCIRVNICYSLQHKQCIRFYLLIWRAIGPQILKEKDLKPSPNGDDTLQCAFSGGLLNGLD